MAAYKVLDANLRSIYGTQQWVVGERVTVEGELIPCKNGLHVCRDEVDLLDQLGPVICECEHSDEYLDAGNGRVCRWVEIGPPIKYWNERTQRHFAADCVESVLVYVDPYDRELLQACIDIARAYADWPAEWESERAAAFEAANESNAAADTAYELAYAAYAAAYAATYEVTYAALATARSAYVAADATYVARAAAYAAYTVADAAAYATFAATYAAYAANAAAYAATNATARSDLARILRSYLDGTSEWVIE